MATEHRTSGLTYEDLQNFPDDHFRREIIDGELLVTPAPARHHQRAVVALAYFLFAYCREHGGEALAAPTDVHLSDIDVVQPDVLLVRTDRVDELGDERFVGIAPDLVVEVSSAGTRRDDLTRKKDLYERHGVPEYWFVDLEADRIEAYRLIEGRYGSPVFFGRDEVTSSPSLPDLAIPVGDVLGPAES
jgi:Uma2 family endonuclease